MPANNILIISDLHLGEDIKPAGVAYIRHLVMLERELEAFLVHYRSNRRDGRPWELIVNGDMVDFLSVCLLPRDGEGETSTDDEDAVYGLGTRPLAARAKMLSVLARHPGVFRALGEFIGAGNELSIVVGNHDVEFHWPLVQETFKAGVAARWAESPAARRAGAMSAAELASHIKFHPWFYFQENVVWVEHGHQYDEYCSFDYFLHPVEAGGQQIVQSLGGASYRYISNQVRGADPHQSEDWNALGYLRMSIGLGVRGLMKMATGYALFSRTMLQLWRRLVRRPDEVEQRRQAHLEKLRLLARQFRLSEETLVALDDLRQRPVVTNFVKLVAVLMLDRIALLATTGMLMLAFLIVFPKLYSLPAIGVSLLLAWVCGQLLARSRGHTDPQEKMKLIPERIRRFVRAPFVVFGHSHYPASVPLAGGGMYFNTGTWVATERPGLLHSFTHVMIRHSDEGPRAALFQWRDGTSRAYSPELKK